MIKDLKKSKNDSLKIFGIVFGAAVLSKILLLAVSMLIIRGFGDEKNLFEFLSTVCDSEHYMYIAENGYASSGDMANKIVFYPLLPYLMKVFHVIFRSYLASGLFISAVSFGLAAVYMYRLMSLDYDRGKTLDALILLFIAPYGMFFLSVYTESLFLMLSIMTVYYARKENWIAAAVLGFFGALSKSQGMLLIVPVVYELILCCVRDKKFHKKGISALLIPMGFIVYLCINKIVLGKFFAFVEYQAAAPWYNSAKWISDGLETSYSVGIDHFSLSLIIYWPQIVLFFASIALIFAGLYKKVRTSYLAFMGVFILVTYLHGWMLSGSRYVISCFVMYVAMASIDNKLVKYLFYLISGMLSVYITTIWLYGYAIM